MLNAEELVTMIVQMKGDKVASVDLVGKLDPVYVSTFREVVRHGAVSAAELFKNSQHRGKFRKESEEVCTCSPWRGEGTWDCS